MKKAYHQPLIQVMEVTAKQNIMLLSGYTPEP